LERKLSYHQAETSSGRHVGAPETTFGYFGSLKKNAVAVVPGSLFMISAEQPACDGHAVVNGRNEVTVPDLVTGLTDILVMQKKWT
jgi:hypothetical protein